MINVRNFAGLLILLVLSMGLMGQGYDPLHPPNTYRSADNPNYWGNRKPHAGYWQQDVHYRIKAEIDEQSFVIDADMELTYWNNSPDTLEYVFFHLFQQAFQPGSYYDNLHRNNGVEPRYGTYEAEKMGTLLQHVKVNGEELSLEYDNTIVKAYLKEPLLPGEKITFDMPFKTFFDQGSMRRRMKPFGSYGAVQFNGVHWYPSISAYDAKFGWTKDQHLGREFYHDFGTWDVELTFAANYIVEATGFLQNRDEVMPQELRDKLDISNFAEKPYGEAPSTIIPYDTTQHKTWKFHAENVHNFAFTANPHYRIGEVKSKSGVRCIALVQEPHAAKWQEVADYTAKVVDVYEEDFGEYGYHKMIVADARDGMEYPMLTLCGGTFPGNKGLIAHEVGHNWFYGMIGNNETYRASLDEGFTQFLTAWSMIKIDGPYNNRNPKPKTGYGKRFRERFRTIDRRVYYGYLRDAMRYQDPPLNTHSDAFNGALRHGGGYGHVYYKMATALYNLQYVLGDELFLEAMQHYFNKWKYAHPYFGDFREAIIEYTDADLNWFFDQWLETTKNIDYQVGKVKQKKVNEGSYDVDITIKRKGRMQMPIDFSVVTVDEDTLDFYIPNSWFEKETDAQTLPRWIGWDKLKPEYTASINSPARVKNVIIDPSTRMADIYMPDNSKKPRIKLKYDALVYDRPDWRIYRMYMRPDLWYNAYDGIKLGFHTHGHYMRYKHKFSFTFWGNLGMPEVDADKYGFTESDSRGFDPIGYEFSYRTGFDKRVQDLEFFYESRYVDGLELYKTGVSKQLNNTEFIFHFKLMTRPKQEKLNYLIYKGEWLAEQINTSLNAEIKQRFNYDNGSGNLNLYLRSSALGSDFDYHYLSAELVNHTKFWRFELHSRVFGRLGTGDQLAPESALFFAGANNEELMEHRLTRSAGFIPPDWMGYGNTTNHFHHGGGLNIRALSGYLVTEADGGDTYLAYKGHSGASVSAELDLEGIVNWKPKKLSRYLKMDVYLFGDAGMLVYSQGDPADADDAQQSFSDIRIDAGAGVALTVKKWGKHVSTKPLTLRFDVPFFLNRTPAAEPDNIDFRWVVGINRSF